MRQAPETGAHHRPLEVLLVFLALGLTSFGGPIAHIGYFRTTFVERRRWLSDATFSEILALCQSLPGPTSSQLGFVIGLLRGGPLGAFAAWLGFTAPPALLFVALASGAGMVEGTTQDAVVHGLKLVAVSVVGQAVFAMARTLTPDLSRIAIALLTGAIVLMLGGALAQVTAIAIGMVLGVTLPRASDVNASTPQRFPVSRAAGLASLLLFVALLAGALLAPASTFAAFYRSGALTFGGGHVVLPLLQQAFVAPGRISQDAFLAGYGAAQAAPGPLFAFAAYLGAEMNGVIGSAVALIAIFLPGFLILIAALPFWNALRAQPLAQSALRGANASVVGVLAVALYRPLWTSAVNDVADGATALMGAALLIGLRLPPIVIVVLGIGFGVARRMIAPS